MKYMAMRHHDHVYLIPWKDLFVDVRVNGPWLEWRHYITRPDKGYWYFNLAGNLRSMTGYTTVCASGLRRLFGVQLAELEWTVLEIDVQEAA
jgi:hypothetical protein